MQKAAEEAARLRRVAEEADAIGETVTYDTVVVGITARRSIYLIVVVGFPKTLLSKLFVRVSGLVFCRCHVCQLEI